MTKTKCFFLVALVFLRTTASFSQQPESPANNLASTLERVVNDFNNDFQNIIGEPLTDNLQSQDFGSVICVPGAEQCIITKYSAKGRPVYSWQATMPSVEEFNDAKKQYQDIFNQLQNLAIKSGDKSFHLTGTYKAPSESLRFYSSILTPDTKDKSFRKLKLEIVLEADMLEWHTRILVYDKEREDDERGNIYEN